MSSKVNRSSMTSVYYNMRTEGQTKIHIVQWKVPNFTIILANNFIRELRPTDILNDHIPPYRLGTFDSRFQVKMQFVGLETDKTRNITFHCLSPTYAFLKVVFNHVIRDGHGTNEVKNSSGIRLPTSKSKEWLQLCTLAESAVLPWYDKENYLEFEFTVKDIKLDQTTLKSN